MKGEHASRAQGSRPSAPDSAASAAKGEGPGRHAILERIVPEELEDRLEKLHGDWRLVQSHHLERSFDFDDFRGALAFTDAVGRLAEEADHHPEITLSYGKVRIRLWTHKVDGLTEADFFLAAGIDRLRARR